MHQMLLFQAPGLARGQPRVQPGQTNRTQPAAGGAQGAFRSLLARAMQGRGSPVALAVGAWNDEAAGSAPTGPPVLAPDAAATRASLAAQAGLVAQGVQGEPGLDPAAVLMALDPKVLADLLGGQAEPTAITAADLLAALALAASQTGQALQGGQSDGTAVMPLQPQHEGEGGASPQGSPQPQSSPMEGVSASERALALFARQAAKLVEGEPGAASPTGGEPKVTFEEMVRLLARQAGEAQSQGQAQSQGNASASGPAEPARRVVRVTADQQGAGTLSEPDQREAGPVRQTLAVEPAALAAQTSGRQVTAPQKPDMHQAADAGTEIETEPASGLPAPEGPGRTHPAAPELRAAQEPHRPVHPEQVLQQASRFVKVMVEGGRSEAQFSLHPKHLGTIAVKLVIHEGTLQAQLIARDTAVKAVLDANLDQLRGRLADQGLQVEQVHVAVGGGDAFGQPHHSQQGQQRSFGQGEPQGRPDHQPEGESSEQPHQASPPRTKSGAGQRLDSLA